ncbi:hypothetical protein BD408DRAFT_423062, partial [Parasitella parasitica]
MKKIKKKGEGGAVGGGILYGCCSLTDGCVITLFTVAANCSAGNHIMSKQWHQHWLGHS